MLHATPCVFQAENGGSIGKQGRDFVPLALVEPRLVLLKREQVGEEHVIGLALLVERDEFDFGEQGAVVAIEASHALAGSRVIGIGVDAGQGGLVVREPLDDRAHRRHRGVEAARALVGGCGGSGGGSKKNQGSGAMESHGLELPRIGVNRGARGGSGCPGGYRSPSPYSTRAGEAKPMRLLEESQRGAAASRSEGGDAIPRECLRFDKLEDSHSKA